MIMGVPHLLLFGDEQVHLINQQHSHTFALCLAPFGEDFLQVLCCGSWRCMLPCERLQAQTCLETLRHQRLGRLPSQILHGLYSQQLHSPVEAFLQVLCCGSWRCMLPCERLQAPTCLEILRHRRLGTLPSQILHDCTAYNWMAPFGPRAAGTDMSCNPQTLAPLRVAQ